jgi:hypothetical protein
MENNKHEKSIAEWIFHAIKMSTFVVVVVVVVAAVGV